MKERKRNEMESHTFLQKIEIFVTKHRRIKFRVGFIQGWDANPWPFDFDFTLLIIAQDHFAAARQSPLPKKFESEARMTSFHFFASKRKKKEERVMIQFDISTSAFSSETKNRVWQKVENVWKLKITLFTSGCCCCSDEDKLRSCFCQPSSTTSDNNFNFVKRFGFGSVPSCWPSPPPSRPSSGNKTWQTIQEDLQRPKSSILLRATQNSLPLSGLPASVKQLQTRVLKREH